ncbi:adenylyltransferase/cytidyltransferase family protein [bacterium]|nr:adenylyltransferase/cytidyltransferase family protein [bacterium]
MPKSASSKVLSLSAAAVWARRRRRAGRTIVATNGCFDLLHYGHVRYLQHARRFGDLLVVGLNGDQSVRRLKGPGRPLVGQRHRAAVLAALACVDAVVIFPQTRATRFLAAVRPQVYVKGGDYRPATLHGPEREVLDAAGTRIRILPFAPGYSTTGLLKKLRGLGCD